MIRIIYIAQAMYLVQKLQDIYIKIEYQDLNFYMVFQEQLAAQCI